MCHPNGTVLFLDEFSWGAQKDLDKERGITYAHTAIWDGVTNGVTNNPRDGRSARDREGGERKKGHNGAFPDFRIGDYS